HDAIVHFAAESHVDRSVHHSRIFVETNVVGTQTLLDQALALEIPRFVHISTDEVYGSIDSGAWDEREPLLPNSPYSASKAAVVNYTKNAARELALKNVRVNVLCPGFFPAEQNRKVLSPDRIATIMSQTPMDRFGEPSELVGAAILLVSSVGGSFMTGSEVYVDGGFTGMRL
ncbi:SDR family oxidoreductase, partial [bacterium]|nr:SDR family oxidoreductase [bacterium]